MVPKSLQHVKEELADVIIYSQDLLDKRNLDVYKRQGLVCCL